MNERDAIQLWMHDYQKKNPEAFVYKISDTTACSFGHPVATGKKPCDVIVFMEDTHSAPEQRFAAYEFKMARSGNPQAALSALAPHQIETLTRIARLGGVGCCIVYVPQKFRKTARECHTYNMGMRVADRFNHDGFWYFHAAEDCERCALRFAPNYSVCKTCPHSTNGVPTEV